MDQWVHVAGRPEWTFVKLHSHGAPEKNARVMLGPQMAALHERLAQLANEHDAGRHRAVVGREHARAPGHRRAAAAGASIGD